MCFYAYFVTIQLLVQVHVRPYAFQTYFTIDLIILRQYIDIKAALS